MFPTSCSAVEHCSTVVQYPDLLVRKARLVPRHDSEATVLNRCVMMYNDAVLTWEADPQHAELAVAQFGIQAPRPQTTGGAKPNAPLDHEELEPDG